MIVGYGNTVSGQEPFRWTQASGMMGLGTLSSRVVQTVARATSADGTVVVGSGLSDTGNAIFRWTVSGGMQGIAYIFSNLPLGGPMSYFAVWSPPLLVGSDGAVVAGTAAQPSNPMVPFAFRWTPSGGLEPLSSAPASIVRAASADGRRIAGSTLASGAPPGMPFTSLPYQAFLFEDGIEHAPARGCACRRRSRWYDAPRSHCDIRRRQHPGWSCDVRRHGGHLSRVAAALMYKRRETLSHLAALADSGNRARPV